MMKDYSAIYYKKRRVWDISRASHAIGKAESTCHNVISTNKNEFVEGVDFHWVTEFEEFEKIKGNKSNPYNGRRVPKYLFTRNGLEKLRRLKINKNNRGHNKSLQRMEERDSKIIEALKDGTVMDRNQLVSMFFYDLAEDSQIHSCNRVLRRLTQKGIVTCDRSTIPYSYFIETKKQDTKTPPNSLGGAINNFYEEIRKEIEKEYMDKEISQIREMEELERENRELKSQIENVREEMLNTFKDVLEEKHGEAYEKIKTISLGGFFKNIFRLDKNENVEKH